MKLHPCQHYGCRRSRGNTHFELSWRMFGCIAIARVCSTMLYRAFLSHNNTAEHSSAQYQSQNIYMGFSFLLLLLEWCWRWHLPTWWLCSTHINSLVWSASSRTRDVIFYTLKRSVSLNVAVMVSSASPWIFRIRSTLHRLWKTTWL